MHPAHLMHWSGHGLPAGNGGIHHAEHHSHVAHHQEPDQKTEMPEGPLLVREMFPCDSQFHESNGPQGEDAQKIGHDGQLIRPALPMDPGNHIHQKVQHHQGKINPGSDPQPMVPGFPARCPAAIIGSIELRSHQRFRQYHRDHHEKD